MATRSAGILLYRTRPAFEVWIAHMGGPFWARKDDRAWSIPKGEFEATDADALAVARREFAEEVGVPAPDAAFQELGEFRYSSGKTVVVFAAEADPGVEQPVSNTFEIEWPPRSGRRQSFPEIDRAAWFPIDVARAKLVAGQVPAIDALVDAVGRAGGY